MFMLKLIFSFSQVPVDQVLEQTVNRYSITSGGIIGFSFHGAVQQWIRTVHLKASDAAVENSDQSTNLPPKQDALHQQITRRRFTSTGCSTQQCACQNSDLPCSEACRCQGYQSTASTSEPVIPGGNDVDEE